MCVQGTLGRSSGGRESRRVPREGNRRGEDEKVGAMSTERENILGIIVEG